MANIILDYFRSRGLKVIESVLKDIVGKPTIYVTDDAHYQQAIVQRGLLSLPVQIRLLTAKLRWQELCDLLRAEMFEFTEAGVLDLVANPLEKLAKVVPEFYGEPVDMTGKKTGAELLAEVKRAKSSREQPLTNLALGIDLGTTYSVVSYVDAQGRPVSLPNAAGDILTPSVVLFDEGKTIVGKEAQQASAMEPDKVAECAKRDMGAKFYRKKINGEHMPPEVISSFVLKSLKADAERKLGAVDQAVITVPAYFDETRRRATVSAGQLAGLKVLDVINEPTAAAIAYGYQLGFLDRGCRLAGDQPLRVLVYDLGGGTFDVTIVEIQGNSFRALATDGDVYLGGKDWDERLIGIAAERFRAQFREDPRTNPNSLAEMALAVETAKRTLSERQKASIYVSHLGSRMKIELTRQEFEDATAELLERTRITTNLVVRQASLEWGQIDRVLLVGGATRMPMVINMLKEMSGKDPERSLSPDEAVAHGAALYADMMITQGQSAEGDGDAKFSVTNINSHSLGILGIDTETGRKKNKVLIPKNTPLPKEIVKKFKTFKANQRSVGITVLEGESERPEICTKVGVCNIKQLPPNLPEGWPILVSYSYVANGRLSVKAKLQDHKAKVETEFLWENSMADEEVELWAQYIEEEMPEE
jgi:molecular chaperone DnaK